MSIEHGSSRRARRIRTLIAAAVTSVVLVGGPVSAVGGPVAADDPVRGPAPAVLRDSTPNDGAGAASDAASAGPRPRPSGADTATVPDSVAGTSRVLVRWAAAAPGGVSGDVAGIVPAAERARVVDTATRRRSRFVRTTGSGAAVYDLGPRLGDDATRILRALRAAPGVASVEPDYWATVDDLPDDPLASQLWGLLGPSDGSPYGIDALGAWPTTTGGGIVVAVLDTGYVSHPDLAGQTIAGYDLVSDPAISNDGGGRDPDAYDPGDRCGTRPSSWHGTHVAGTIAAIAGNGQGVFGGAPGVKIEPVRVLGTCGGYSSDIADGIRWASGGTVPGLPANAHPARVLNLSLSGSSAACPTEYASAIADARSRGSVVVVAAGNSAANASGAHPANCPAAITVAAIGEAGKRASFSNFGPAVDLAGPGVGVISTVNAGASGPTTPTYASYDGTSMAAPHVTVAAALIAATDPALDADGIEAVLDATVTPFAPDAGGSSCAALGCGLGAVNAGRASASLGGPAPVVGRVAPAARYPAPAASLVITAVAVDQSGIASAAVRVDDGPWLALTAADGAFGEIVEAVKRAITAPGAEGDHAVCVRATDAGANTSDGLACTTISVDAGPPTVATPVLDDAAIGPGEVIAVTAGLTDGAAVASAEVRVDSGAWTALAPVDGAFGQATEDATGPTAGAVTAIDAGGAACALLVDATVRCWGFNAYGGLGDGTTTDRRTPVPVVGLSGVTAVDSGFYHACALLDDTTVRCWGFNAYGQLGDGTTTDSVVPVEVTGLSGVTQVAVGVHYACALLDDQTVRCWGINANGQLGDGTSANRSTPVAVAGLSGVTSISASNGHACAVRTDHTVRCWGFNPYGGLGDGSTVDRHAPVTVAGLTNVAAVAAGYYHTCALLLTGSIRCWGGNQWGQIGDGTTSNRLTSVAVGGLAGVQRVAVGGQNSCVVLADRTVRCWGVNGDGEVGDGTFVERHTPVAVPGLGSVADVSVSGDSCALRFDGTVRCWGVNLYGELGDGTVARRPTPAAVAGIGSLADGDHTICVRATDAAGHTSSGTACTAVVVTDTAAPTAVAFEPLTVSPTSGLTIAWSLSFDEPVTGLAPGDIALGGTSSGWSVTGISGSGAGPYVITASAAAGSTAGTVAPTLGAGAVTDLGGNAGPAGPLGAPDVTVTRILATVARPASPTKATTLAYGVTFSEAVTGLTASDFSRTGTAGGCVIGSPAGSGAAWTVAVTGCSAGTVVLALKALAVADLAGHAGPSTAVSAASVTIDRTKPTTGMPTVAVRTGARLSGAAFPTTVSWAAADAGGAGVARYELARSTNGGSTWTTLSTSLTTASYATAFSTATARFRVRAIDRAGNVGSWTTGANVSRSIVQGTSTAIRYTGSWATTTAPAYSGGSVRGSSKAGSTASFSFTGRSIGLVTTRAPSRGRVRIYVNGTLVATLNCASATTTYQTVAWSRTWTSTVTRTVKLVVEGTAGRPRVDLDAFVVVR